MRIVPAGRWREWMNETTLRYANRCLPLLMANEAGWWLCNERRFTAEWSGDDHAHGLTVDYGGAVAPEGRALSLFGYGILSFEIPYVIRTPRGWNLLARGPANLPKDGIQALEGLIESDWAVSTFTMNWKFTRPGAVCFDEGEPFCMIVPQQRGALERFEPAIEDVRADPDTDAGWEAFRRGRHKIQVRKFLAEHAAGMEADRDGWESHYFRGLRPDGRPADEHVTKTRLRPFDG